jgi:hypothetical protein
MAYEATGRRWRTWIKAVRHATLLRTRTEPEPDILAVADEEVRAIHLVGRAPAELQRLHLTDTGVECAQAAMSQKGGLRTWT